MILEVDLKDIDESIPRTMHQRGYSLHDLDDDPSEPGLVCIALDRTDEALMARVLLTRVCVPGGEPA
jgi:hypothetical protein